MIKRKKKKTTMVHSVVSEGTVIKGDFFCSDLLEVNGRIQGNVEIQGTLKVGIGGRLEGDVSGQNVHVDGDFIGNIDAHDKLVVGTSGHIKGHSRVGSFVVDKGARIDTELSMFDLNKNVDIFSIRANDFRKKY